MFHSIEHVQSRRFYVELRIFTVWITHNALWSVDSYFSTFLFRSQASSEFIMCPWTFIHSFPLRCFDRCVWVVFNWNMLCFFFLRFTLRRVHCIHSTRTRSSNKISRSNVLEPQPLQSFRKQTSIVNTYRRFKGIFVDFRAALKRNHFDNGCCLSTGYDTLSFTAST